VLKTGMVATVITNVQHVCYTVIRISSNAIITSATPDDGAHTATKRAESARCDVDRKMVTVMEEVVGAGGGATHARKNVGTVRKGVKITDHVEVVASLVGGAITAIRLAAMAVSIGVNRRREGAMAAV
jgi:hypothetical protein